MQSFADSVLAGVEHRIETEVAGEAAIEMNLRRQIYLIFKELVTNVARHANAETVEIRLTVNRGELRLSVIDDGVGIDAGRRSAEGGTGLASLRRRAAAIGASLDIEDRPEGGTAARVVAPRVMTRNGHRRRREDRMQSGDSR
jgi:signal transduction histidine kinase